MLKLVAFGFRRFFKDRCVGWGRWGTAGRPCRRRCWAGVPLVTSGHSQGVEEGTQSALRARGAGESWLA